MLDKLGGRKFLLTLIVIGVGSLVQALTAKGVTTEFAALLIGAATAFGASNAAISLKSMGMTSTSEGSSEEPVVQAPPVDLAPVFNEISFLNDRIGSLTQAANVHAESLQTLQEGVAAAQNLAKAAIQVRQG